jgi:hypothetical protein
MPGQHTDGDSRISRRMLHFVRGDYSVPAWVEFEIKAFGFRFWVLGFEP